MVVYILQRVMRMIPLLFLLSLVAFLIIQLPPATISRSTSMHCGHRAAM